MLVELLSDTVRSTNLHHFLGIYATFLGNLRHFSWEFTPFGEKFTPIYTTWWPGAETSVNPRKLPAWRYIQNSNGSIVIPIGILNGSFVFL